MPRRWIRSLFARPAARRAALRVEGLEGRDLPATLDLSGGTLTYAAAAGINNSLSVTVSGSNFVFADGGETITTTLAGATGSGSNTVSVPFASVTALVLNLGDGTDAIPAAGITTPGAARAVASAAWASNVATLTTSAAHNLAVGQTVVVAGVSAAEYNGTFTVTGVPSATTFTYALTGTGIAAGTGGTATSTGAVAVTVGHTGAGLTVSGPISTRGNIAVSSANALAVGANILSGGGTITLAANTDGAGAEGFSQTAGLIATGNTSTAATTVTVNTAAGGTGNASLDNTNVGTGTTGGRLTVATNGGSVVYAGAAALSAAQQGTVNGGSAPARVLQARSYVFTATGTGGVGTSARPMQLSDVAAATTITVTANAGSGGVFVTDWGANAMTVSGASATGAGDVRMVTANGSGHNLTIGGNVSAATGNIYLASDDNITVGANVTIGGAGFSGTVWMSANRDRGTAGQTFTMNATSAIVTSSTANTAVGLTTARTPTTQAVYLDIEGDAGTPSALTVGSIRTGDGGRIVVNSTPRAYWTSGVEEAAGRVVPAAATNLLDAGPTGTVELIGRITATVAADAVGTAALPVRVAGGTVVVHNNGGNVYVTGAADTSVNVTTQADVSGQTGALNLALATEAGALTVASAIGTLGGGAVSLTGVGGVVLSAAVGNATTGAVTVTGPLSGAGGITGTSGVTVTQATDSTYAGVVAGGQGLTKAGAGNLTLSAAQTYTGATAVTAGTLTVGTGGLTGTSGVTVGAAGTLAGSGPVAGAAAVTGEIAPGGPGVGQLATGALSFAAGGTLTADLVSAATPGTTYDQVAVTGAVSLTNAALRVLVGFTPTLALNDSFRIVDNDGTDAVTGQFTNGTQVAAADNPAYIFTVSTTGGSGNDVVLTLTTILPPLYLDVTGGNTVSYGTSGSKNSTVSLAVSGGRYVLSDAAGAIGLGAAAVAAGWTVDGPTTVSGPVAGITAVLLGLSDGADAITALNGGTAAVTVSSAGTLTTSGTLTTTGNLTFNGVPTLTLGGTLTPGGTLAVADAGTLNLTGILSPTTAATLAATTITATAGSLLPAPTVTLTATAIGTAADPVRTQTTTLTAAGGAGGAFVTEADGATVTASATGAGAVSVANTAGTLTVAGVTTAGGAVTIGSGDAVVLTGDVAAGAGTITIAANTDGAGAEGFTQTAGTITTTNATAAAATVTVNTAAGGTGDAVLDSAAVGAGATGTLTVRSNGGSILYGTGADLNDSQRGLSNGGSAPTRTLVARGYVFAATGAGSVGTDGRPVQSKTAINGGTVNASAGSGGVFWTDWDQPVVLTGASATGAGTVRVVTANVAGHNLTISGNVSAQTGNILLGADDNIAVGPGVVIGGSGFSGTVWMQANRDQGTAGQTFTMDPTSAVVTSNATNVATTTRTPLTQAVYLDISGDQGTPSGLTVANVTAGDGGRIVVNAIPNGIAAEAGVVLVAGAANVLSAGPTGTVELVAGISATAVADAVGTAALPVRVPGGSVVVASNFGNVFVTSATAASFAATTTAALANQTAAAGTTLATAAGVLTVNGPTTTVNTGAITLNGAGGVAVAAPLGGAGAGAVTINAGTNPATLTSTLTLGPAETLAVTAAGGLTVAAGRVVTGTGAAANATPVAVQAGGELSPAGTLRVGNTTLGAGTLRLDLPSVAGADSLAVTGTADVTGGTLALVVGGTLAVNDSFVILSNDGTDAVVGQFADGAAVVAANDPRYFFTLNYAGGDGNDVVATLTQIVTTTLLDVNAAGLVTLASADGLNNTIGVSRTASAYTVTDPAGVITLSVRAVAAGWGGSGTNAVTGPTAGVTGLALALNTGTDTLATLDAGPVPVTVSGTGSLAVAGTVSSATSVAVTGVTAISGSAAGVVQAPTVSLTSTGGIGTSAQRVRTTGGAVTAAAGSGGVFLAETDGADFTATSGGGTIDILNATGTLNVAGPLTSGGGTVVLSSGDAVTLGANVSAGAGTITIAANTDGAGSQGYDQKAAVVTTTNTTAAALRVTVNTAGGGTGDAVIGQGAVGNATGGTVTVNTFGGSILWSDDPAYVPFTGAQLGTGNGGANVQTLKAFAYSFATGAAGGVGTDARPLQLDNAGANDAVNSVPNLTATAGTGGVYATVWDAVAASDLTLGTVTAQGAGAIRVVTANSGGHNLWVTGNVSTGSGTIYLAADDVINVGPGVVIGGAGFSGTVWMQANRDQGTAGQTFTMDPTSAVVTSSTVNAAGPRTPLTQAVYLDISGDQGTPSVLTVANVTTGAGGRVVLNAVPNGIAQEAGRVVMADAASVLTAGAVEVTAGITPAAAGDAVGTAALPLAVAGGSVVLAVNHGNTFVASAGAMGVSLAATTIAGQTAAVTAVLSTAAGALTIAGPTATLNGGALSLTGAGGVVVAGALGGAATGAISITGALSGTGDITLGTGNLSLAQATDSTYGGSIAGPRAVTKLGAGTLTLTGNSTYAGATTVSAGGLRLAGGALGGTSGLAVADVASVGGTGAVAGAAVVSGALAPDGTLALGGLSFGAGPRAVTLDLTGPTGYDQLAVTGAVDLTGSALTLTVAGGFLPVLGTAFTVVANDGTDPVTGTFAGLAQGATIDVGTRTYAVSYAGGDGNDVVLTVTHVTAGPPVNTVPAGATLLEDGFVTFPAVPGSRVGVDNPDLGAAPVQVTVAAGNGVLTLSTLAGLSFTAGDGTADATMTFRGTLAAINAALDGLRYAPAADFNGADTITVTSNDLNATGDGPKTDTDSIPVTVTAVNDVPVFGVSGTHTVAEDAGAQAVPGWATGVSAGPADEAGQSLTFLVTTNNDVLFAVLPALSATGQLTYTPAPNANGSATVTVRLRDGGGTADGGVDKTAPQTFTIVVTPVNDAPVVGPLAGPIEIPSHGPASVVVAAAGTVTDIDTPVLNGGTLTVSTAGGDAGDVLAVAPGGPVTVAGGTVSVGGTPVGTVSGGNGTTPLTVALNGNATLAAVEAVLRQVVFRTPASAVPPGDRFVSVVVTDGQGGTSAAATVTVAVLPNVSPVLGGVPATLAFTENDPATLLAPAATASDLDSPTLDDGALTVELAGAGAGDALTLLPGGGVTVAGGVVSVGGTPVGTLTGGTGGAPLVVTFDVPGAAPAAAVQALLRRVAYANPTDTIAPGPRTVTFTLTDGDGGTSASPTTTLTVTAVNDAPTLTLPAGPFSTNEDTPLTISGASVVDLDAGTSDIRVTLTVAGGRVSLATTAGLAVTGNDTALVDFTGPQAAVTAALAALTFTPALDFNGPASIQVLVSDQGNTSGPPQTASGTLPIAVAPVNDAPVLTAPAAAATNEDIAVAVPGVTVSDVDSGAGHLRVTLTVGQGTLTVPAGPAAVSGNGTASAVLTGTAAQLTTTLAGLTYRPAPNGFGPDTLTVHADDQGNTGGPARTADATVPISVASVNDAPGGADRTVTTPEDTPYVFAASDFGFTDPNDASPTNALLEVVVVTLPGAGSLLLNGAAVAPGQPVLATDITAGRLTFAPATNASGTPYASFTFQVRDDGGTANGGVNTDPTANTITVAVTAVNDAPTAAPAAAAAVEDGFVDVDLLPLVADVETATGSLTFAVSGALNGTVALRPDGHTARFTPAADYFGATSFTYTVTDTGDPAGTPGNVRATSATVSVAVAPVNDAPTFTTASVLNVLESAGPQARPGFATGIAAGPANEAAQGLTFTTVVTALTGTLAFDQAPQLATDGTLTFATAAGTRGTATVRVTLTDDGPGTAPDANATVRTFTISVGGVNDAPEFTAGGDQTVSEDAGPQTVAAWAAGISAGPADESWQTLTFVVSTDNPALFAAPPAVSPTGTLTYTPATNASGTATVTVRLRDDGGTLNGGTDTSPPQTFVITVLPVNDAPTPVNDAAAATEDGAAVVIDVLANDTFAPDTGEVLTVVSVGPAANGTVAVGGGGVSYTPAPNFSGTDTFTYTVSDGNGGTATATVTVTVAPVNDPPTAADDALTVAEDAAAVVVPVTANDSTAPDPGEMLTVVSFTPAAHGSVTLVGGQLRYTPAPNYFGADSFTYTISDGNGGTATATVTVTVTPVNDNPTAAGDTLTVTEDTAAVVDVLANDSFAPDVGEVLTVVSVGPAAHGTVAVVAGGVRYIPAADYSGPDSFTYTIGDGNGGTATATVNVTVTPVNDPPVAVDDSAVTPEDGGGVVIPVLANDTTGPEPGETLTITALTQPANGTASLVAGGVRYTPARDFNGSDSFTYTLSDGNGGTATATVRVVVTPVSDPPVAVADAFTVPHNGPATTLAVLANDGPGPDGGPPPRVTAVTQPAAGGSVAVAPGGGAVVFTPAAAFAGDATFTYSIGGATATVTVTVGRADPLGPVRPVVVGGPADGTVVLSVPGATSGFLTPFAAPGGASRTASADVDGDGVADLVLATGPGVPFRVTVLNGADGRPLVAPFDPFGGGFTGGGFVAAGDLDGDGRAEFVVTPDEGGGPRVSVFGTSPNRAPVLLANFLGIDDANFRGGARAAVGDVDGDGTLDVVVTAGFGGGPRAAIFDGETVLAGRPARLVNDFLAFPGSDAANLRNGAYVAAGDIDGDGRADLVFGGGPGGAPRVFVLSGALVASGQVDAAQAAPLANFFVAGDTSDRGGARVAVTNSDGDGRADVAVGSGTGRPASVRLYLGKDFAVGREPAATDLDAFDGAVLADGVYVG
ncbi:MAG: tandem-95 repeat protein [Gemmataceae bacterium]